MKANAGHSLVVVWTILCSLLLIAGCGRSGEGLPACDPLIDACASEILSEDRLIGGDLARGEVGDFLLENDHARYIIQRPVSHIATASQFGGNLIDADVRRPARESGRDVFGEMGFLVNLAGTVATESVEVEESGGAGGQAVITARGGYDLSGYFMIGKAAETTIGFDPFSLRGVDIDQPWPLQFEVRYILSPQSQSLRVEFTAFNTGDDAVPLFLTYFIQGGQVNLFVPGRSAFGPGDVGMADMIFFEPVDAGLPVGYGLAPDERVNRFLLSMLGCQALVHKGGILDLLFFPDRSPDTIPPGGSITLGATFTTGEDLDEAIEVTHQTVEQPACSPILGRVEEEGTGSPIEGADVTALQAPGALIRPQATTNARTGPGGLFRLCLPTGPAALITGQTGRPYFGGGPKPRPVRINVPVRTETPEEPDVILRLPAAARLLVSVIDSAGSPVPARLTILGIDSSPPDSRLEGDAFDPWAPGVVLMEDSASGFFDVLVEPGDLDLVVTRGIEYDLFRQPLFLSGSETRELEVQLHQVVDTGGYLSGDFHVHAAAGPDCTLSYRKRVTNMLAEGVDVIVSTDHDYVTDYWPTIRELGLMGQIATLAGQEISTFATGHFGPFPLPRRETPDGGAVNWVGKGPTELAEEVLSLNPEAVFQIMHPRAMPAPGNISNYFTAIDLQFDADGPYAGANCVDPAEVRLPAETEWLSTDFNAMEILTFGNVQGLSDWFNLLNAGWRLTGTGNSDTHTRWVEASGYARNLVFVGEGYDDLDDFDADRFTRAVRDGHNSAVLGPFIEMTISRPDGSEETRIGETFDASEENEFRIGIRIQSPSWLVSDQLTIYENGIAVYEITATPSLVPAESGGMRNEFLTSILHQASQDAFYAASVTGNQSLYPLLPYNWESPAQITMEQIRTADLPGTIRPFSVTNPVWIDVDGDGTITPSHLIVPQDCQNFRRDDRTNPYVEVPAMNCDCVPGDKCSEP